jgi:hypothetical protein
VLNEIEERIVQSVSKTGISGLEIEESQTLDRLSEEGPCFRRSSYSCSRNRTTSRNSGSSAVYGTMDFLRVAHMIFSTRVWKIN